MTSRNDGRSPKDISFLPSFSGGALGPDEAASYCGCSRRHFETHIAPHMPYVDLKDPSKRKAMPRYLVADLDAFLLTRRRSPAA